MSAVPGQEAPPTSLDDTFRCERYACSLLVRRCLERQLAKMQVRVSARRKTPGHLAFCASGQCEQGNRFREQFAGADLQAPILLESFIALPPHVAKKMDGWCAAEGCPRRAWGGPHCSEHRPEAAPAPSEQKQKPDPSGAAACDASPEAPRCVVCAGLPEPGPGEVFAVCMEHVPQFIAV